MKKIIGISFDTDDLDDDNSFLIIILKKIDKDMKWRVDCFTACEDYLNSEIKEYLSIKELEKILSESKKAMFIRILGENINGKHKIIRTRSDFFSSDYEVCVFCCDSAYYEVYSKQEEFVLKIKDTVSSICNNVEIITNETVCRLDFVV